MKRCQELPSIFVSQSANSVISWKLMKTNGCCRVLKWRSFDGNIYCWKESMCFSWLIGDLRSVEPPQPDSTSSSTCGQQWVNLYRKKNINQPTKQYVNLQSHFLNAPSNKKNWNSYMDLGDQVGNNITEFLDQILFRNWSRLKYMYRKGFEINYIDD